MLEPGCCPYALQDSGFSLSVVQGTGTCFEHLQQGFLSLVATEHLSFEALQLWGV